MRKAVLFLFGAILLSMAVASMSLALFWGYERVMHRHPEAKAPPRLLSSHDFKGELR
jgi:hypothetical protein